MVLIPGRSHRLVDRDLVGASMPRPVRPQPKIIEFFLLKKLTNHLNLGLEFSIAKMKIYENCPNLKYFYKVFKYISHT